ncbi:hypothetical protein [Pseudomonas sp. NA-150]|uniref:hypothetical protein n=1 Tax=Pseudomonas sp. NA-150 TaxID=3367525 RepID=UPI0037C61E9C
MGLGTICSRSFDPSRTMVVSQSRIFAVLIGMVFIIFDQWIKAQALWMLQSESFRFGGSLPWLDVALSLNGEAFLSLGAGLAPVAKQLIFIVGVAVVVSWVLALM